MSKLDFKSSLFPQTLSFEESIDCEFYNEILDSLKK